MTRRLPTIVRPAPTPRVPPVFRPQLRAVTTAQAMMAGPPGLRRPPAVPPVYRPGPGRRAIQLASYSGTPGSYFFTTAAAVAATMPFSYGEVSGATGRSADSGVDEGDVGSYAVVQYLEKVGDKLTGDHQPSGAAVKEAIRLCLHAAKPTVLTRQQARNAYRRAVTVVVHESWHIARSRTYGGSNTPAQIAQDAADLFTAAFKDFQELVPDLAAKGWSPPEIQDLWDELNNARLSFFATGTIQSGTLK